MAKAIQSRVGETFTSNEGLEFTIVEYFGNRNSTVQFKDGTLVYNKEYADLKKGTVKNPNHKTVYGVGYFGVGKYVSKTGDKHNKDYVTWRGIIERCYNEKFQERHPTYIGCSVVEEWHNFQVFAKWCEENYNPNFMEGWAIDKDIIIKGNKIYSPETCAFVPAEVNNIVLKSKSIRGDLPIGVSKIDKFFKAAIKKGERNSIHLGAYNTPEEAFHAYKVAKEEYIKEIADKWKDKINPKVYEALYNYQVEITD